MRTSLCRSCGAEVIWVSTENGRWMPLDAEPYTGDAAAGHFVIRDMLALAVPPDVFPEVPHYVSHFSTCPDADNWRHPE